MRLLEFYLTVDRLIEKIQIVAQIESVDLLQILNRLLHSCNKFVAKSSTQLIIIYMSISSKICRTELEAILGQ
jgi:hypothetical protein